MNVLFITLIILFLIIVVFYAIKRRKENKVKVEGYQPGKTTSSELTAIQNSFLAKARTVLIGATDEQVGDFLEEYKDFIDFNVTLSAEFALAFDSLLAEFGVE